MGRKRNFKRYKNFFCPACCLIFIWFLSGCQHNYYPKLSIENDKGIEGRNHLDMAKNLALNGDFEEAFDENTKAYETFPAELKQAAIFQKALLHAHPDNSDRSYEKAMVCFELVDKDPSDFIFEYNSTLIFSTLKGSGRLAKKMSSKEEDAEKTKKMMEQNQKKIRSLLDEQKKLKKYIAKLKEQIKQLKEVDLNSSSKIQGVLNE